MKFHIVLFVLIGCALLGYAVLRAVVLPITHDESTTCLDFATTSVAEIVTYARPIPNNHILNTLFVKLTSSLFGMTPLAVRLPNLLAFILYFIAAVGLVKFLDKRFWFQLLGLALLLGNHYLFDFFSLARGYGMACALMLAAVWMGSYYLRSRQTKHLASSISLAALAVYANFAALSFFLVFAGLLGLVGLWYVNEKKWSHLAILFFTAILMAVAIYQPIRRIVEHDELSYWGTNGFFKDTVVGLVQGSFGYTKNYFLVSNETLSVMLIVIFMVLGVYTVYVLKREKLLRLDHPSIFYIALFVGVIIVTVVQFYTIQTPYPLGRAAIPFFPLAAISFLGLAKVLADRVKQFQFVAALLIALGMFNFLFSVNLTQCREWWYDANTTQVIRELAKQNRSHDNSQKVSLTTNWLFYPSFLFYTKTDSTLHWLNLVPLYRDTKPTDTLLYHYGTSEEKPLLDAHYDVIKIYNDRFLMKHNLPCSLTHRSISD